MAGKNNERRERIKLGVRNKISGTKERPRLVCFQKQQGFVCTGDRRREWNNAGISLNKELGEKAKLNQESSKSVGKKIAEKALASGVQTIVFDRNGYLYHGNIKALADGAREGGLKF
jgi:large subunit ribosomal protein L18